MKPTKLTALLPAALTLAVAARAVDLPLLDDAQVLQASSTFNYGAHANLAVISTAGSQRQTFMRFDVHDSLPPGTRDVDIAQAFLVLYVNTFVTAGQFEVHKVTSPLWVAPAPVEGKATGAASSGTITWANTNGTGANLVTTTLFTPVSYTAPVAQDEEFIAIEVTDLVKQWLNAAEATNYGLALKPVAGQSINLQFDSKENGVASHRPVIHVTLDKKRVAARGDVTMGTFTSGPQP